ncbi:hypothetical protein J2Z31_001888 [Sinorhizobium kostiense]|uniref:Uncharacterized protein n=1 Tax=Sinorhizobium kostiense TaxID=76747 RepID=A0ABS4QXM3_9HYPH|nr:hypothetical protein [Sinorhizobium kostiense]
MLHAEAFEPCALTAGAPDPALPETAAESRLKIKRRPPSSQEVEPNFGHMALECKCPGLFICASALKNSPIDSTF